MSPRIAIVGHGTEVGRHALYLGQEDAELVGTVAANDLSASQSLLQRQSPDGVIVLLEPSDRAPCIETALGLGCSVLCRSPFAYDPLLSDTLCLATVTHLCYYADQRGLVLCALAPLVALVPSLRELATLGMGPAGGVWSFGLRVLSPAVRGERIPEAWLLEQGTEALALLLGLVPGAQLIEDGIQLAQSPGCLRVGFDCHAEATPPGETPHQCAASVVLGRGEEPLVEIEVNGLRIRYEERRAADGTSPGYLGVGQDEATCGDLTRLSVRAFVARLRGEEAGPIVDANRALASLRMLLRLLRAGTGQPVRPLGLRAT